MRPNVDPNDPPAEPPPSVEHELLWRIAVRLYRDHQPQAACECGVGIHPPKREAGPTCLGCGKPSPCSGRRLALLGLNTASCARKGRATT
jgi:hypothetical protein